MPKLSDTLIKRLSESVHHSRRQLEPFRKHRLELLKQFVGSFYSDDGADNEVPLNLIELATTIYTAQLAANVPQVMIHAESRERRPKARKLETAMNQLLQHEIGFEQTLKDWVMQALFGVGVLKIGMCPGYQVEIEGFTHDVYQPYADIVGLDDWVHDIRAKRWDQIDFCGNRYRLRIDDLRDNDAYDQSVVRELKPAERTDHNETGDQRSETISRGTEVQYAGEGLYDLVELWDLWLPRENLLVTIQADDGTDSALFGKPVRVAEWDGPEGGPFHLLSFQPVPDQILPLPPASLWRSLHATVNSVYRKLGRQALRQKKIGVFRGVETDAARINATNDGEWAHLDSPQDTDERSLGGIDQGNYGFVVDALSRFSWIAGNLDTLGGLSPQSETVGQDKLLAENASKRVTEMQGRTMSAVHGACKAIGWYLFYSPYLEIKGTYQVPGTQRTVPSVYTKEDREGDFWDYEFSIEPYSMQYQSPAQRLNTMTGLMQQVLLPMAPLLAEQGITIDMEFFLREFARFSNMKNLDGILIFSSPQGQSSGPTSGSSHERTLPANTTRTYERTSRPGSSRSGNDAISIVAAMGGNPQSSEMAALQKMG